MASQSLTMKKFCPSFGSSVYIDKFEMISKKKKKIGIKPLITIGNVSFQKVFDFEENGIDLDIL